MLLNIFVENMMHFLGFSSKEEHLFEIELFCNIIKVFTATFNQFNASLMNKSINFFPTKSYWPKTF